MECEGRLVCIAEIPLFVPCCPFLSLLLQLALMMEQVEQNRELCGLPEERLVGVQEVVVPYHIVRYRLRDGCGAKVQLGMTINCLLNAFLIDGTQIVSSRGSKVTRLLLGRSRLIEGLELGLQGVRKGDKLRLVVSSQYAYGGQEDISLIPPHSKLIFEVDVLDFSFTPVERMGDTELYFQVYHHLEESDALLIRGREEEGLLALTTAYRFAKKIKQQKCNILSRILLKWANILHAQGHFEDSLLVLNRIDRPDDTLEDCLRLYINLYQALDRRDDLEKLVERMYEDHSDNSLRRICVNYYKETENWERLKKLPGYDFKKDRFVDVKISEKDRPLHMRFFG